MGGYAAPHRERNAHCQHCRALDWQSTALSGVQPARPDLQASRRTVLQPGDRVTGLSLWRAKLFLEDNVDPDYVRGEERAISCGPKKVFLA